MDLRQIYHIVLDRAWMVLGVFVVAVLLTVGYVQRAPRIFASTATLQVEQQEQKILKFDRVVQDDLRSTETLRTILQTLKTRSLLERVASSNDLAMHPSFNPTGASPPSLAGLVGALDAMINVRLRAGTRLIDVTVEHTDASLTALIANTLVQEFIRSGYEQDSQAADLASGNLMREGQRLKRKLHDSETALQKYMVDSRSISLEERQNIVTPKLKELNTRVTDLKSARLRMEADHNRLAELGTNTAALLTLPSINTDPTVMGIQVSIAKQESEFSTLKLRYRPEHPKFIQMVTQISELERSLSDAIARANQNLTSSYESAKSSEAALGVALREQEDAALQLNQQAIQYSVLNREVESDRVMYDAVVNRLKETSLTKELTTYKVRVVEPALRPNYPVKPEKSKLLLRGIILGVLAGVGLALGMHSLDNTIKTVDQAEGFLGVPVLATLPPIRELEDNECKIVVEENSNSANAEAFRTLRAALSMLGRVEDRRSFLFTSAHPQEGKTFSSLNFAISLSQQGLRTLLIDCDLRRPSVEAALLGRRSSVVGVSDFLTGRKSLDEVVNSTEHHHFFYVGVGSHAPNPAELLAQGRFAKLIEEALLKFDRVVIDSAPIQAVSDTLLILEGVQTVCLTVRSGRTPRQAVQRAIRTLQNAGAPVAGVLLNFLKRPRGGGAYYYYDYHYSGYSSKAPRSEDSAVIELPKAAKR